MTVPVEDAFARPMRATGAWSVLWRTWYRLLRLGGRQIMRIATSRGYGNIVVLRVRGRRTGTFRELPVGLLTVADRRYLGHPNGDTGWTLDLRKAGTATVRGAHMGTVTFRPVVLARGDERDAVLQATFRQHPFPGGLVYRLGSRHLARFGVYFRLVAIEQPDPPP